MKGRGYMLINEKIEIVLNHRNHNYYHEMGYVFNDDDWKNNKTILVDQSHIMKGIQCGIKLHVRCDYCGKDYYITPYSYYQAREIYKSDSCDCNQCRDKRKKEIQIEKYGTTNWADISRIKGFNLGRSVKYNISDLNEMADCKGYEIQSLFNDHIIVRDIIQLRCKKHDIEFESTIGSFMNASSHNCQKCFKEYMSEVQREATIEEAISIMNKKGYKLISPDFINNCDQQILYVCNKHQEYGIQKTSLYGLKHSENNCKLCHSQRGDKHYNWKGGISSDRDKVMSGFEYQKWAREIFKRDNYTCQCCGKHGGTLNAHHIYSYSFYPDLRTDIRNGVLLCEECHSNSYPNSFHKLYGVYDNNLAQLQEYFDKRRTELGLPLINIEKDILDKGDK